MSSLPNDFTEEMKRLLGEEYEAFLASYRETPRAGLRLNTRRETAEDFPEKLPFSLSRVPWISNGYYYGEGDSPAKHPYYYAGLYYLQEPSAMTPASLLPVEPGDRVLDLCAAPGGKATELGAKLQGQGCLFANDISNSRAKALLKNLELFGIGNCMVTSETPERLAEVYPGYFDKILIDAPCSGEGMFRKDPGMVKSYAEKGPSYYADLQRTILTQVVKMLRPGGMLLYSTCTFSKLENEGSMDYFLSNHPEFHLEEIPWCEGFCPGKPELVGSKFPLEHCVRLFPHKIDGEGHFLALLTKDGERTPNAMEGAAKSAKLPAELEDFLKDVSMPLEKTQIQVKDTKVFLMPEGLKGCKGLRFLRSGLYMGELLKKRFEPSQAFAMVLKKQEYASVIDLPAADVRILRYLKGETIEIEDGESTRDAGWQLVCVDGYPLGWGKLIRGTLRNKYFSGWRMNA